MSTAFPVPGKSGYVVFIFLYSKSLLSFSCDVFFAPLVFKACVNSHIFVTLVFLLLLIPSLIPFWLEKMLCMILVSKNVLLSGRMGAALENIPHALAKGVCAAVGWRVPGVC